MKQWEDWIIFLGFDEREYDNTMSASQIAQTIKSSKRTVERIIKKLRDEGVIERCGPARGGYWEIKK